VSPARNIAVAKRPGEGWGLYLQDEKRWLEVTFDRKSDAEAMAQSLTCRSRRRQ
jgi:hypothetical protein